VFGPYIVLDERRSGEQNARFQDLTTTITAPINHRKGEPGHAVTTHRQSPPLPLSRFVCWLVDGWRVRWAKGECWECVGYGAGIRSADGTAWERLALAPSRQGCAKVRKGERAGRERVTGSDAVVVLAAGLLASGNRAQRAVGLHEHMGCGIGDEGAAPVLALRALPSRKGQWILVRGAATTGGTRFYGVKRARGRSPT
jgi:hypothetical protein